MMQMERSEGRRSNEADGTTRAQKEGLGSRWSLGKADGD